MVTQWLYEFPPSGRATQGMRLMHSCHKIMLDLLSITLKEYFRHQVINSALISKYCLGGGLLNAGRCYEKSFAGNCR